jgi:hypothetical protein
MTVTLTRSPDEMKKLILDDANYDQLHNEIFSKLKNSKVAVEHEFLGQEWADVIVSDISRYCDNETLTKASPWGLMNNRMNLNTHQESSGHFSKS